MLRMIRLHGNAAEYIPLALVLMPTYEINGGWHMALHIVGIALMWRGCAATPGACGGPTCRRSRRHFGQSLTWLSSWRSPC